MRKSCRYQGAIPLIVATMFAEYLAFSYELIESFSDLICVKAVYLPRYNNIGACCLTPLPVSVEFRTNEHI